MESKRRTLRHASEVVERVECWVRENFKNDFSLDDVAAALKLSRYHVSHQLRRAGGLHAIRDRYRSAAAEDMLRDSDAPVKEVAYRAGLARPAALVRLFRRRHHLTPTQFRAASKRAGRHSSAGVSPQRK